VNYLDNACYNNPCLNGATCQSFGKSYTCNCAQSYSGTNCQICKKRKKEIFYLSNIKKFLNNKIWMHVQIIPVIMEVLAY